MSVTEFSLAWAATGMNEQGYADNPLDSGGPTNMGITQSVARAHGYTGDMKDLPATLATQIAKTQYWDILSLDDISVISLNVAMELFDTGILSGVGVAGLFLQRSLNLFNRSDRITPDYAEVVEDGVVGKVSVFALKAFMAKRGKDGEKVFLRCLNSQQGYYLQELCRNRNKDEEFVFGWFLNRVVL